MHCASPRLPDFVALLSQTISSDIMDTDDIETPNSGVTSGTPDEDGSLVPTNSKTVNPYESDFDVNNASPDADKVKSTGKTSNLEERIIVSDVTSEESIHGDENINPSGPKATSSKLFKLPTSRIKSIVKLVPSVHLVNSEAIALIGKATEMFLNELVKESHQITLESGKKTITLVHVKEVTQILPQFEFLDGMLT